MRAGIFFLILFVSFSMASPALGDDKKPSTPFAEDSFPENYRLHALGSDALGWGLLFLGGWIVNGSRLESHQAVGGGVFALGALTAICGVPALHAAGGNSGRGSLSVTLRLAVPAVTALALLIEDHRARRDTPKAQLWGWGLGGGLLGAQILDQLIPSYTSRLAPVQVSLIPMVTSRDSGVMLRVGAPF